MILFYLNEKEVSEEYRYQTSTVFGLGAGDSYVIPNLIDADTATKMLENMNPKTGEIDYGTMINSSSK